MIDQEKSAPGWSNAFTQKERSTVQRSVSTLLSTLAPERVVRRGEEVPQRNEQHRTPRGCVLQGVGAALSVSWFSDNRVDSLGELHVSVWDGVVSRGGASYRKPAHATLVSNFIMYPSDATADESTWRDENGRQFDTPGLVAHCHSLLERQIEATARQ
jgi:hypothetical protein